MEYLTLKEGITSLVNFCDSPLNDVLSSKDGNVSVRDAMIGWLDSNLCCDDGLSVCDGVASSSSSATVCNSDADFQPEAALQVECGALSQEQCCGIGGSFRENTWETNICTPYCEVQGADAVSSCTGAGGFVVKTYKCSQVASTESGPLKAFMDESHSHTCSDAPTKGIGLSEGDMDTRTFAERWSMYGARNYYGKCCGGMASKCSAEVTSPAVVCDTESSWTVDKVLVCMCDVDKEACCSAHGEWSEVSERETDQCMIAKGGSCSINGANSDAVSACESNGGTCSQTYTCGDAGMGLGGLLGTFEDGQCDKTYMSEISGWIERCCSSGKGKCQSEGGGVQLCAMPSTFMSDKAFYTECEGLTSTQCTDAGGESEGGGGSCASASVVCNFMDSNTGPTEALCKSLGGTVKVTYSCADLMMMDEDMSKVTSTNFAEMYPTSDN